MENDCLRKEPKDYAFQFIGPDVQFYLRRGVHWNDCFLLIMSGSKITKIKPEDVDCKTDSDFKTVLYIQQHTDGRYTMGLTEGVIGIMTL